MTLYLGSYIRHLLYGWGAGCLHVTLRREAAVFLSELRHEIWPQSRKLSAFRMEVPTAASARDPDGPFSTFMNAIDVVLLGYGIRRDDQIVTQDVLDASIYIVDLCLDHKNHRAGAKAGIGAKHEEKFGKPETVVHA